MSWLVTPAEKTPVDRFGIGSVSLLLHGNGTNGSTSIIDSSPSPKTVTAVGNAQISTAQSKFGGASIAFDGNGALTIPHNSAFSANADFTLELWLRPAGLNRLQFIVDKRSAVAGPNSEWFTYIGSDNKFVALLFNTAAGNIYLSATSVSALAINTWYHLAFTLSGTTLRLFVNGALETTSSTPTGSYATNSNPVTIGRDISNPGRDFNGYIDELRITKGVARYTSSFTPPTAPFPDI